MNKQKVLRYDKPAENSNDGWEQYSLPIGNGYCGASVFGGIENERIQFTTNSFANTFTQGGVTNFAEILLHFSQNDVTDYERGLRLTDGVAYSTYRSSLTQITREAFYSYPDRVFVYRVTASEIISFSAELVIPFLGTRALDEGGRTGTIRSEKNRLTMRGELPSRALIYEGILSCSCNGTVENKDDKLIITDATDACFYFVAGTSYKLCSEMFLSEKHEATGCDPHDALITDLNYACASGWAILYARHVADYGELAARAQIDLGGVDDGRTTDKLLDAYKNGEQNTLLEELYFAFGRHLLISSSRKGSLPASLQGVWTIHDKSPWGSFFWHNINIQMNYWPAFSTDLCETFEAYADYWKAYLKQAELFADDWIRSHNPENFVRGDCGWIIGTAATAYDIGGIPEDTHSGPGTGGLTAKLFWDYYDFTRDEGILRDVTYPAVHGSAKFLTKSLRNYDGRYLCNFSASPEQILSGDIWIDQHDDNQKYYQTVGCAFDQQMTHETVKDDLACQKILGAHDRTTDTEVEQFGNYSPVQIGYSGQIKEYEEEHFYGEIGEAKHRHLSQLVALMPGTTISSRTPAWKDAAEQTLLLRGDKSTGWALAHRLCAWARVGNGEHAYILLKNLLQTHTNPNLWDEHPPFQIDGNFGGTNGIAEMLLQSHNGYIELLPSVPAQWKNIEFKGLKARGNFSVDCKYSDGLIEKVEIFAPIGGIVKIGLSKGDELCVIKVGSKSKVATALECGVLTFTAKQGARYTVTGFALRRQPVLAEELTAEWAKNGVKLSWKKTSKPCSVYRAVGDDSSYTLLSKTATSTFIDREYDENKKERLTYKVIVGDDAAQTDRGSLVFLHPASKLEEDRYKLKFKQNNLHEKD